MCTVLLRRDRDAHHTAHNRVSEDKRLTKAERQRNTLTTVRTCACGVCAIVSAVI
jgi:hypothetical protein